MESHARTLDRFRDLVRRRPRDATMAALIVDSPWLPGYAGVDTLDFYFDPAVWLAVQERVVRDLPDVALVPGAWVELGMAAEPSGWGVPIRWSHDQPPRVGRSPARLPDLAGLPVPDPEADGLMPVILRRYEGLRATLAARGLAPRIAAARGPLTIAAHLHGLTEFLLATQLEPEACHALLEKTTALCIAWLEAQLRRMEDPIGVLVLDDVIGLLGPPDVEAFALARLRRIFDRFPGRIRIYHNDAAPAPLLPGLARSGMDVFHLSHTIDLAEARRLLGPEIVLMGNLPPLHLLARGTPGAVRAAARRELARLAEVGPIVLSAGGGVSPATPIENLRALAEAVAEGDA